MRDTLIRHALQLSQWRQSANQDALGWGVDAYQPDVPYDYAEAWALWGRGYLRLFRLTHDRQHLAAAESAANWLLEHPNPGYRRLSWGLPWAWERWGAAATLSYCITTVQVGELLLDLHQTTGRAAYRDAACDVAEWLLEENGGERQEGLWRLYYAPHPNLQFPVVNPTAMASGLLAGLALATRSPRYEQAALETAAWVAQQQRPDGSWPYSGQGEAIDNVHTGFTLEGLWTTCRIYGRPELGSAAERGTRYYWRRCFLKDGRGLEQPLSAWSDWRSVSAKAWLRDRLAACGRPPRSLPESRLHGYASALRVLALATRARGAWAEPGRRVAEYVNRHLAQADGSYRFRGDDERTFIRQEAHMFDALACLAEVVS